MRRPLIAGNWKMNTTVGEAATLVKDMLSALSAVNGIDRILCPPFISLQRVSDIVKGSSVEVGAQNMYFKDKGAFTGEISPLMLKELCKYVILGHSERRQFFGETDETVNAKLKAALAAGLLPIFCIGESLEENEAGRTKDILARQVTRGLKEIAANKDLVIAYEPVWAIGTGKAATGDQAGQTIAFIRNTLASVWNNETAQSVRILYGGSVTSANIAEFISEPHIDGALVGGASLKAADFIEIVRQTAAIKQ
ncbi:MAG: triose-phosphate isomerase [Dehalococcoidia bacterium]|jgi:triosephosphate isomerase